MEGSSVQRSSASSSTYVGWPIPGHWEDAVDSVTYDSCTSPPPIALVCGPGNSGKSTFSRLLLNTLLQRYKRVGYLDTDVGQPEFSTPGCLSLHIIDNPTHDLTILHLKKPERCFFYGDVNAHRNPKAYLNYIFSLYDYFFSHYYQTCELNNPGNLLMPLVVNTSGWVKGAGFDMLVEMLQRMSPTHVVQIRVSVESKNLPRGTFWLDKNEQVDVNMIEISAVQDSFNRPAIIKKDARIVRELRFISYFRLCLPRKLDILAYKDLERSLASIPPCEVPISRLQVMHLHCQVSSSKVDQSLNATIVGLAVSSSGPASNGNCSTPWCLGLGIVRAVDASKDRVYVITPVPCSTLEEVDLLLQGYLEIPDCLLQVNGHLSPCMSSDVLHELEPEETDEQISSTEKLLSGLQSH